MAPLWHVLSITLWAPHECSKDRIDVLLTFCTESVIFLFLTPQPSPPLPNHLCTVTHKLLKNLLQMELRGTGPVPKAVLNKNKGFKTSCFPQCGCLEGIAVFSGKKVRWLWGMCAILYPFVLDRRWRNRRMRCRHLVKYASCDNVP